MSPILLVFLLSSHLPSFVSLFQCRGKDSLTLFCILAADTGGSCSPHSLGPGWAPQLQNFPSVYQHRTHLFNKFKSVENWVQNGVFGEKNQISVFGCGVGGGESYSCRSQWRWPFLHQFPLFCYSQFFHGSNVFVVFCGFNCKSKPNHRTQLHTYVITAIASNFSLAGDLWQEESFDAPDLCIFLHCLLRVMEWKN